MRLEGQGPELLWSYITCIGTEGLHRKIHSLYNIGSTVSAVWFGRVYVYVHVLCEKISDHKDTHLSLWHDAEETHDICTNMAKS